MVFMGDVNNFAANNIVSLDEIKEINLLAKRIDLGIFNDCL
jgi:hypothetical protein